MEASASRIVVDATARAASILFSILPMYDAVYDDSWFQKAVFSAQAIDYLG